jgi:CDP-glucose 4,6-dehydratase
MWWSEHRVFVTGCTGFLGSWLTRALVERGASVVGLIRDSNPRSLLILEETIHHMTVVHGAVEDFDLLERVLNEYEIDTVFHLAAQTIVGLANRHPRATFETTIRVNRNLMEACRHIRCVERVIVASSDKAYGGQIQLPYDESTPLQGQHPYDVSKSCGDLLAQAYFQTYRLPVCITRSANFYGGGDLNFSRIVPGTIKAVLQDESPLIRSDGQYVRDYLYIVDAVEAYLSLAEQMLDKDLTGQAFNISAECHLSVLALVTRILQLMEKSHLQPTILNQTDGEIREQCLSGRKAREHLGWQSRYTLDEGLQHTIAWYRTYLQTAKLAPA